MDESMRNERTIDETPEILTERQKQYLEAYIEHGSASRVAKVLGVSSDTAIEALQKVARKLEKQSIAELRPEGRCYSRRGSEKATALELRKLLVKQEYRCALSGVLLQPDDASLDHRKPISLGGSDEIINLQWVHKDVNKSKGPMDNDEFIKMCQRVAAWNG